MKKYVLYFLVVFLSFGIGTSLVSFSLSNLFTYKPFKNDKSFENNVTKIQLIKYQINKAKKVSLTQLQENKEKQKLTFSFTGAIACGLDAYNEKATFRNLKASDGKIIQITLITSFQSEIDAQKRFKLELRKAENIIEVKPILDNQKRKTGEKVIFESDGKVYIVKYYDGLSDYNENYYMDIVETPSLRHARAFTNTQ